MYYPRSPSVPPSLPPSSGSSVDPVLGESSKQVLEKLNTGGEDPMGTFYCIAVWSLALVYKVSMAHTH